MESIRIVIHIGILYLFYYAGEWIQETLNLMIPGSIIGMLLLLCFFYLKIFRFEYVEKGANLLLSHMPFLFLPATAGIMAYFQIFIGFGLWLVVIVFLSTLTVMVASGWTAQFIEKRRKSNE
ncbi:CidA/LrgA family protein [Salibacterium salarium]|uniref:CidA/LrgA family protein n=1 Tax=Salibacterium salarium TaxID=284579 RepID=A0A3R9QLB2_9BACI|nr:CidA/LrgA family protein [Salibacterium salarium]RSL32894.1 CidA/LrgA family protein [Salibacterium salarium]